MPVPLPAEIIHMIVNEVTSADDRRSVRAVNRAFCNAATPAAFRTVGATNRRKSALGLISLLESELAQYVEEAIYRNAAADDENGDADDEDASYGPDIQDPLVRAFSRAARLPCLKSLRFTFNPTFHGSLLQAASVSMQHALIATVGEAALHLRSLTLEHVTPVQDAVYATSGFAAALSSITHLRLTTSFYHTSAPIPSNVFWLDVVHTSMLDRAKNLVSLTLACDVWFLSPVVKWKEVTLPRLKYLAVKISRSNIEWVTQRCKEDFVPRHGQLEWVDLGTGADAVWWIRHTHADPEDVSEYETPPSEQD
ncbi:hypothetical protein FA95DRAFT_348871 [Auriscalpium vulgare]|uniref:Uncharacterized protein n=1 Tax=Auriscalpium vulgare TaxID=40419 RepID=A0ACB8RHV2_9AGAM|nr:hypothetical protein FA95DRAFT_348871 [Auriscalpium vulgare]